MTVKTSIQGFPRIGEQREWKRTLESFWRNEINNNEFEKKMQTIRLSRLNKLKQSGLDYIPVGDFSCYDHMLDMAVMFNMIPKRFASAGEAGSLDTYFAMARGTKESGACEMTKWFNTNYHYIVPEIEEAWIPKVTYNKPLAEFKEAEEKTGIKGKPVLVGPYTLLKLSKGYPEEQFQSYLDILVTLYAKVIGELTEAGAEIIQMDEPALVYSLDDKEMDIVEKVYQDIHGLVPGAGLLFQTYFESITDLKRLAHFPVKGIGIDLVHDQGNNAVQLKEFKLPEDKILALGVIDGRNVWKTDLETADALTSYLRSELPDEQEIWLQPSCSLLHVPVSLKHETKLSSALQNGLAFAEEKLQELQLLKYQEKTTSWKAHQEKLHDFRRRYQNFTQVEVRKAKRNHSFEERFPLQQKKWELPLLPTTTIGSFPQTLDMRRARTAFRRGEMDQGQYDRLVKKKIDRWIKLQEDIGLDVLVHGEFERNDMVEFFGEKLDGFAVTENGWVQSYGSRCVKPPVIYSDVKFNRPMTVKETAYAGAQTRRPVKGMLTGPVTILNWSFERMDISREQTAFQIAEALQPELKALEENNIEMIQVDEPALREGLPLKKEDHAYYLDWAVNAFRAVSEQVQPTTQVHTHMCYSEFNDIMSAISAMDADVISIETSRSHGEIIEVFEENVYDKGIGLGVYDIHSPRIPPAEEMRDIILQSLRVLPPKLFWINPDCGLKTRTEEETIAALANMQSAAEYCREAAAAEKK